MGKRGGWVRAFNEGQEQVFRQAYGESRGDAHAAAKMSGFQYKPRTYLAVWKRLGLIQPEENRKRGSLERKVYNFSELP